MYERLFTTTVTALLEFLALVAGQQVTTMTTNQQQAEGDSINMVKMRQGKGTREKEA